jgi:hypothetical protein
MHLTLIEPLDGSALCKRKLRCPDGQVINLPEDHLARGRASIWPVPMAGTLASALDSFTTQAIVLGLPRTADPGPWWLVTKDQLNGRRDVLARCLECFGWPQGPGWLLVDLDKPTERPLEVLQYLWPEIAEASLVIRPSSSAGILPGKDSLHVFVLVADLSQAKRMLEELARRAAYVGMPEFIDVSVGSPERIVYVAPPILLGGLTRQVRPTWWQEGCAVGMANICEPERASVVPMLPVLGELSDPDNWPVDLAQAVEGYMNSVVHGLCDDIAKTDRGKRSTRLFASGARLGNYAWTRSRALRGAGDMLLEAAGRCGYFEDYGVDVAQMHLARGWEQGCQKPETGLPALARWQRKDELMAMGAALITILQRKDGR